MLCEVLLLLDLLQILPILPAFTVMPKKKIGDVWYSVIRAFCFSSQISFSHVSYFILVSSHFDISRTVNSLLIASAHPLINKIMMYVLFHILRYMNIFHMFWCNGLKYTTAVWSYLLVFLISILKITAHQHLSCCPIF